MKYYKSMFNPQHTNRNSYPKAEYVISITGHCNYALLFNHLLYSTAVLLPLYLSDAVISNPKFEHNIEHVVQVSLKKV